MSTRCAHLRFYLNESTKRATTFFSECDNTIFGFDYFRVFLLAAVGRVQLEQLEIDSRNLLVYSLVAAAFVSYLSCASEDHRKKSLSKWLAALNLEKVADAFSLKTFLTSEQELMIWRSQGLPSDDLAVENAIAILQVNQ